LIPTNTRDFSNAEWKPQIEIHGYASILFQIVVSRPVNGDIIVSSTIPEFVSKIIEGGLWSESEMQDSCWNIFRILKENNSKIVGGVDSVEVLALVKWIESTETPGESTKTYFQF
jgi:hypothetical protein